ncbi:MAG: glycosyltransferase family 2 protein [Bacteroidota bacterium]
MNNLEISVISPVYGAASLLPELVARIDKTLSKITSEYEIILVEDNSPDNSWEIINQIVETNDRVVGLSLSRNFGQQNALTAGFDYATGDYIITLDCDLQDEPENIEYLYHKALEGYEIVFASRVDRQDGFIKKTASFLFYKVLGYLTETQQDNSIANYILYSRKAVDAMAKMGDYYRYYPMLNKWVGFKSVKLSISHAKRKDNMLSSYTYRKRLRLAFSTIVAFSDKPLRLILGLGFIFVLLSLSVALILVVRYITMGHEVSGWLSVFLSIWFLSGITTITLGLIGIYIGKIFETVKNRPTYLIKGITRKS